MTSVHATTPTIIFKTQEELERALYPLNLADVQKTVSSKGERLNIAFKIDPHLEPREIPQRYKETKGLLQNEVHKTASLTVYYPERPHDPHHLAIKFNRKVTGLTDITKQEAKDFHLTVKKICEIYKQVDIKGYVITQADTSDFIVEILPHLPGFKNIKNIAHKMECNRYVLLNDRNLSEATYQQTPAEPQEYALFWKIAFNSELEPLNQGDTSTSLPHKRKEAYLEEGQVMLQQQFIEALINRGGQVEPTFLDLPHIFFELDHILR